MRTTLALLGCAAALVCGSSRAQATMLATASATVTSLNFANAEATSLGRNGGDSANFRSFAAFRVSDLLLSEGLSLGDLNTAPFRFSFDTSAGASLLAGSYRINYLGFLARADLPTSGKSLSLGAWNGMYDDYNIGEEIDSQISDTEAAQSFTFDKLVLSGVTSSGPNDYVVFGVRYNEPQVPGTNQPLSNFRLDFTPVPEPSTIVLFLLVGVGIGLAGWGKRIKR